MVFTKLLPENALAIRPCNYEATSELLLPKVACCIPVLPSHYIRKCAARVLKRSAGHQYRRTANSTMTKNDLLDFKADWRKFCDHSYFRDLTSDQRRLRK